MWSMSLGKVSRLIPIQSSLLQCSVEVFNCFLPVFPFKTTIIILTYNILYLHFYYFFFFYFQCNTVLPIVQGNSLHTKFWLFPCFTHSLNYLFIKLEKEWDVSRSTEAVRTFFSNIIQLHCWKGFSQTNFLKCFMFQK